MDLHVQISVVNTFLINSLVARISAFMGGSGAGVKADRLFSFDPLPVSELMSHHIWPQTHSYWDESMRTIFGQILNRKQHNSHNHAGGNMQLAMNATRHLLRKKFGITHSTVQVCL